MNILLIGIFQTWAGQSNLLCAERVDKRELRAGGFAISNFCIYLGEDILNNTSKWRGGRGRSIPGSDSARSNVAFATLVVGGHSESQNCLNWKGS